MAEAVILSAVTKIGIALGIEAINHASSKFKKFITQLTDLQGSMARIRRELRLMHEYLCRMDVRNRSNQTYEIWVEEVRMLVHGIEDIVDEYLYLVGQTHDTGWSTYLKNGFKRPNVLLCLNRIASLVKEAEVNLVHLFQAKDRWVSMVGGGNTSDSSYIIERSQHLASISRSLGEEDLVGVEENRKKLEQLLAGNELERSVIVLHGMGGIGKTTLAANIYRKEGENFDCHCWISVSQTYCREDILRTSIKELYSDNISVPSNIDTMNITSLEETLKSFLEQRKYLIVLDDVWTLEAFHYFSKRFIQNKKGSRLVVTTRVDSVAELASDKHVLPLERISSDESWELFCKTAFPKDTKHDCPTELTGLAQQVVSKCKGVPLAIVTVGRLLLVCGNTKEEYKRILDQLDWELINNPSLEHVRNILYLSYIYLPTYLKSCFLYCSLFPEDYLLKRKKLIRLWVAEGFIKQRGESTMEEVAEGYLKELVQRNMLQINEKNSLGRMKSFRMHDIIRELAVDLCQRECFGIVYKEDRYRESLDEKDARRLVIHKLKKDVHQSVSSLHLHCLQSVIALDISMPSSTLLPLVAEKCRYMSVLELSGLPITKVPDSIGDLFNLRYLGLRGTKVKILPNSVEKLLNLLTLDISGSGIKEMPTGIGKLKKLRQLFTDKANDRLKRVFQCSSAVLIPKGLENLTNLQTLLTLEAQDESARHLGELRQLRSLEIWNVKGTYCGHLCDSLAEMRFLSYLHVNASNDNEVLRLNGLPSNLQRLSLTGRLEEAALGESQLFRTKGQNLYSLSLYWSQLREDPLPSLSQFSNLTNLMMTRAYSGNQLIFLAGWFPRLKTLRLRDLPNLEVLEMKAGTMGSLEIFTLVNLGSMTEIPPGIEFLAHVKYISFREITDAFLALLRRCPRTRGMRWRHTLRHCLSTRWCRNVFRVEG